jgi:CRP/FNR family transcriptional activator FtrB
LRPQEKPEIARLPLFAAMNPEEREIVFSASFLQVFPPQLVLFEVGQRSDFLHVLVDGMVELFTTNRDRDTTMAVIEPVRSFILAAVYTDMPYLMSARTLSASRVMMIPSSVVRNAIDKDMAMMRSAMRELSLGYRGLVRSLTDMKLRQSVERLANHLLLYSRKSGGANMFQLPMEKRLLASLLGMTPENLSRAFGALIHHGVNVSGTTIEIVDRDKLEAFARPDPFFDVDGK